MTNVPSKHVCENLKSRIIFEKLGEKYMTILIVCWFRGTDNLTWPRKSYNYDVDLIL